MKELIHIQRALDEKPETKQTVDEILDQRLHFRDLPYSEMNELAIEILDELLKTESKYL